jgi:putative acetyltransferase
VLIREYRDGDADAIAGVFYHAARELGPRRYSPEQVAAWAPRIPDASRFASRASDGRITLVATHETMGIVAFGDLEPDGHIDFLYCRPEVAGTGVASQLLDTLLERAAALHIDRLFVEASELARGLFERKGFSLVRRRDFDLGGVPMHNYLLERKVG